MKRIKELLRLFGLFHGLSREGIKRLLSPAYHDVIHNWWGGRTDKPRSQMDVIVVLSAISLTKFQLDLCLALLEYPSISLFKKQLSPVEQKQLALSLENLADSATDLQFIKSSSFSKLIELGYSVEGESFRDRLNQYLCKILNRDELIILELLTILSEPVKESNILLLGAVFTQNVVDALSSLQSNQFISYSRPGFLTINDKLFAQFIKSNMSQSHQSNYRLMAIKLISQLANDERTDLAELYDQVAPFHDSAMVKLLLEEDFDKSKTARFHILLGEAYVLWTKYDEGERHLMRGLRLTNRFPPLSLIRASGDLALSLIRYLFVHASHKIWPRWSPQRETHLLASRGYSRLVEVKYHKGESLLSICYTMRSLLEAQKGGDSTELAEALTVAGQLYFFLRMPRLAKRLFARATSLIVDSDASFDGHYVYLVKSTYEVANCRWADADHSIQRMIQTARGKGIHRRLQDGLQMRAIYAYVRGETEKGMAAAQELQQLATRHANLRFELFAHFSLGYFHYLKGDIADALVQAEHLQQRLQDNEAVIHDHQLKFNHFALLAILYFESNDMDTSIKYANEAMIYCEGRFKSSFYTLPGYMLVANVYLNLWKSNLDNDELAKEFRRKNLDTLEHLEQFAAVFPLGQPAYHLYQGLTRELEQKPDKAVLAWKDGLRHAERLDMSVAFSQLQSKLVGKSIR